MESTHELMSKAEEERLVSVCKDEGANTRETNRGIGPSFAMNPQKTCSITEIPLKHKKAGVPATL
jgi:hypothetical protein